MILQNRDKKILELIYEHNFMEQEHVRRLFPNYTETRRRIIELKRAGFVLEEFSPIGRGNIVRLTRKGWYVARNEFGYNFRKKKFLSPFMHIHDAHVISTRMRLEELWDGKWIPEKAYRKGRKEVPDGIFKFPSGNKIYIEVESSLKARNRFLIKHKCYGEYSAILILYVCTQKFVLNGIKSFFNRNQREMPAYAVMSLEELMKDHPTGWAKERELVPFKKRQW